MLTSQGFFLVCLFAIAAATTAPQVAATTVASTSAQTTTAAPSSTCESQLLPQTYTRNTRYVMLTGFAAFLVGGIALYLLSVFESGNKVVHSLSFLLIAGMAIGYFSLWEGLGSFYRDDSPRCSLITVGRWIALLFTLPLVATAFTLFSRVERTTIVGAAGATMFAIFSWTMGAAVAPGSKYVWWVGGVLFAVLAVGQFFAISQGSARVLSATGATAANVCFMILSASLLAYATIWVIGATGTGYLHASTEIALYAFFDVLSHLAVSLIMIGSGESVLDGLDVHAPLLHSSPDSYQPSAYGSSYGPSATTPTGNQSSRQFV